MTNGLPNPTPTNLVKGRIQALVSPTPDGGGYVPSRSARYTCTLLPEFGFLPDVPVGRPIQEIWAASIKVKPLAPGSEIVGIERGGVYVWLYVEEPKTSECAGGGG